jgi:hypothetical protein
MCFKADFKIPVKCKPYPFISNVLSIEAKIIVAFGMLKRSRCVMQGRFSSRLPR